MSDTPPDPSIDLSIDPRIATIAELVEAKQLKEAEKLYAALKTEAQAKPKDEQRALAQAQAAVKIILGLGLYVKLEDVQDFFKDVLGLAAAWPRDTAIALERANASYRLIYHYGRAEQPEKAAALYAELRALTKAHLNDSQFALRQANGAVNLICAYEKQPDEAQEIYGELKKLARAHKGNSEIALTQAGGAINLISAYDKQPDKALGVYGELKKLARAYEGNAEFALEQAKGAFNLGIAHSLKNAKKEALRCYEEAAALCAPLTSPEAREVRAKIERDLTILRAQMGIKEPKKPAKARSAKAKPKPSAMPEPAAATAEAETGTILIHRMERQIKLLKVINEFKAVKKTFTDRMQKRKDRVTEFLKDESLFAPEASVLLVLRKWNSFTPIIADGQESDRGGGYFLFHKGVGLVIDPGYDFIEQFHEAGGQIHDITHIAITHAHDDHTAQLEQLLTMLHQYNKENERGKESEKKKVTLLLNHSAMKKFSGFRLHKDCSYVKRVVCLNAFDKEAEPQRVRLDDAGEVEITVLPAYHDDVFSADYAVGLGLKVGSGEKKRVMVLTSDTGLFPPKLDDNGKVETYKDGKYKGEKKVCEDQPKLAIHILYPEPFHLVPDLLIPHIGSIKEYEFAPEISTDMPMFYPNHLGLLGTATLIQEMQPKAVVLSEFGSELKKMRVNIVKLLRKALDDAPFIIPGDSTVVYDIANRSFLCHEDCCFHPPADLEPKELEDNNFIGLFLKQGSSASLELFRDSLNRLRSTDEKNEYVHLPYMREPKKAGGA